MDVDISAIKNRDLLLEALWKNSKPAAFFTMHSIKSPDFNLEKAKKELNRDGYADYICGRVIKANIYDGDNVNSFGYDRDNGEGAFQKVVNSLL